MQHEDGHGHGAWTVDMYDGHVNAARTWTCIIYIGMDIQHGLERAAWPRTCRMEMDVTTWT
jgi:hypothetical protein